MLHHNLQNSSVTCPLINFLHSRLAFPGKMSGPSNALSANSAAALASDVDAGAVRQGDTVIPSALERRDGVVIFNPTQTEVFLEWWLTTRWGLGSAEEDPSYPDPVWNSELRKMNEWQMYEQGASERSGKPVVVCLMCNKILVHPNNRRTGSGNLRRHLKTPKCKEEAEKRQHYPAVARLRSAVSTSNDVGFFCKKR